MRFRDIVWDSHSHSRCSTVSLPLKHLLYNGFISFPILYKWPIYLVSRPVKATKVVNTIFMDQYSYRKVLQIFDSPLSGFDKFDERKVESCWRERIMTTQGTAWRHLVCHAVPGDSLMSLCSSGILFWAATLTHILHVSYWFHCKVLKKMRVLICQGDCNSRILRWVGQVARMQKGWSAFKILTGKPTGRRPLEKPRRRWKDNNRMNRKEIGINTRDWVDSAQHRNHWRVFVNAALNLRVP